MRCSKCPHYLWSKHADEITRVTTVKIACGKEKREIMHDDFDKNNHPVWCPLKQENDIKPTEDYQHSENKPQEKCQFVPETPNIPDYIAGFAVSDLLFIAQIVGGNPHLIEQIKDGYAFGHAVGYKAGLELFEKKVHEAISKIATEPIRLEQGDGFDFTKVKFEIPPYKQQDEVINMARLYGVPVFAPKVINVVNPSTDGDDNK